MRKYIKNLFIKMLIVNAGLLFANYSFADSYDIGTGGGSAFQTITNLLQDWVDFMTGPYGKAVVVGSIVIGVTLWAVAPREGILGFAIRGAIAGAVILNIAVWMRAFGGGI